MHVRSYRKDDPPQLVRLIAEFRAELSALRGRGTTLDASSPEIELEDYGQRGWLTFVAENDGGRLAGYIICRVDDRTVWAESLFVLPESCRRGAASALYAEADATPLSVCASCCSNRPVKPRAGSSWQRVGRRGGVGGS